MDLNNTSAVSHCDLELVTINVNRLAAGREMTKGLHHQSADGIDLFIAEVGAVGFIEIFNRCQRAYRPYDGLADGNRYLPLHRIRLRFRRR